MLGMQPAMQEKALDPESEYAGLNLISTFAQQHDLAINSADEQFLLYITEINMATLIVLYFCCHIYVK